MITTMVEYAQTVEDAARAEEVAAEEVREAERLPRLRSLLVDELGPAAARLELIEVKPVSISITQFDTQRFPRYRASLPGSSSSVLVSVTNTWPNFEDTLLLQGDPVGLRRLLGRRTLTAAQAAETLEA